MKKNATMTDDFRQEDDDANQCSEDLIDSLRNLNNDFERRRFLLVSCCLLFFQVLMMIISLGEIEQCQTISFDHDGRSSWMISFFCFRFMLYS